MEERVLEILRGIRPDIDFLKEDGLLTNEVLDSFDILAMVSEFAEKLHIDLEIDEIVEENFDSAKKIARYLAGRIGHEADKAGERGAREKRLWAADRQLFNLEYPDEDVIRFLKKNFPAEGRADGGRVILDFGCGSGRNETVMMDMGLDIYAVDYNQECLDMTRYVAEERGYRDIHYILNDRMDLPVKDGSMDCFLSLGGLFYFDRDERNRFFWEMNRVLKQGGLVFADFRGRGDSMEGKGKRLEDGFYQLEDCGSLSGICYWFCGEEELRSLFESHGFYVYNMEKTVRLVDNMQAAHVHYFVWAKKTEGS